DGGIGVNVLKGAGTNYWDLTATELVGIAQIDLGVGHDLVTLSAGNDRVIGGAGDDQIDGGAGIDTAVYVGNFASYAVSTLADGRLRVADQANGQGTDLLRRIEVLEFANGTYSNGVFTPTGVPANTAPTASGDAYAASEDTALVVSAASGVLANDTDANGDA